MRRLAVATSILLVGACASPREEPAPSVESAPALDLARLRPVDLSHPYDESTLYWPTSPSRFESETLSEGVTEEGYYYLARRFTTPEHGGTHLDAPLHFAAEGWAVDEIPFERLIAPAVVIDVSEAAAVDRDYLLSRADVIAWEAVHGSVPEGSAVLLRTGWSRYWEDEEAYYGRDTSGAELGLHFPSFGVEAARYLVEERRIGMLGVDTASIDHGPSTDFLVHRLAGEADVPGLENLTRLDQLPATGAWLIALPMKLAGGSGGPVRVMALVPR